MQLRSTPTTDPTTRPGGHVTMSSDSVDRLGFMITNLDGGGAERTVSNLARGFSDHHRQLLLFEDSIVYPFDGDVHVVDIPIMGDLSRTRKIYEVGRGLVELNRRRRSLQLDTCLSFLTWPNLFNVLSSGDERTIISVRNNPSRAIRGPYAPVLKAMIRAVYPRADHIVAISEDVRRDLIEHFGVAPDRVTTIYNPIQFDDVRHQATAELPEPLRGIEDVPTVISVGRLALQKGQWHLIRAFSRVHRRVDNSTLLLLGVGPFRDYLVELAQDLGLAVWAHDVPGQGHPLDYDVVFWGFAQNPFPILSASDVFAFPSLWEGLGNVLLESLTCELPVVSADCRSGPREILAPDTPIDTRTQDAEWADFGVLLPVCDGERRDHIAPLTDEESLWAEVLTELLTDEQTCHHYATRGRMRASDFGLDDITEQWRQLLGYTQLPNPSQS